MPKGNSNIKIYLRTGAMALVFVAFSAAQTIAAEVQWFGQAAYAVKKLLKTKTVVPMHYGTFPPLKGTPEEFKAALGNFKTDVVVMEPGETRKFE